MSTPPIPPPPSQYANNPGYGYSKAQVRAQRRIVAAQARSMRQQARIMQRRFRLPRRRSIVGPVLLVALGFLLLLGQTGRLDWSRMLSWYSRWWPAILIAAGSLLLLEWAIDQKRLSTSFAGQRVLGPGVGLVLLLLAGVGWSLGLLPDGLRQRAQGFSAPGFVEELELPRLLNEEYEWDDSSDAVLPSGWPLAIHNPHGNVAVSGTSMDGRVHLTAHKKVYAWQQGSADALRRELQPTFSKSDQRLLLEIPDIAGVEADISLEIPKQTSLNVRVDHGDTLVSAIHGTVTTFGKGGDLTLKDVSGDVNAHVTDDHASISAQNLSGSVRLQGRTGDLHFADINGTLALEGDFFGSTHLEHVSSTVLFQTSRTHFEAAGLTGSLDLDGGPAFQADGLVGAVVLRTKNRTITLDNVTGGLQLENRNGSVNVTMTAPIGTVEIQNKRGSVDLALPTNGAFHLAADAQNGDLENDFDIPIEVAGNVRSSIGGVNGGGSDVRVSTSDGGITIRKLAESDHGSRAQTHGPLTPKSPPFPGKHLRGGTPDVQRM